MLLYELNKNKKNIDSILRYTLLCSTILLSSCSTVFVAKPLVNGTYVFWRQVDDVDSECRLKGAVVPIGQKIIGCASYTLSRDVCTIITGKITDHEILGHELRHCFEENWHD